VPTLHLPDFKLPFVVETDASAVAVGAVLSQSGRPLAFFSKKMSVKLQASSVYVREMYAITESIKKWRQYLIGQHFKIITDQKSLNTLLSQIIQTPEQQKWTAKLQGYDFQIVYRPGKENAVADALSRQSENQSTILFALSSPIPQLVRDLQQYLASTEDQEVIHACTRSQTQPSLFSTSQGLLFFRHQIFVPAVHDFRHRIMVEFHASLAGGHSGIKPTLKRIAASFYWPKWTRDVHRFVQQCPTCQQNKYMPTKTQGLLQPLPIPKQVWEEISMDFITHLPSSAGHSVIWVVCDRLTKYAHFIALPTHFTAQQLAKRFSV